MFIQKFDAVVVVNIVVLTDERTILANKLAKLAIQLMTQYIPVCKHPGATSILVYAVELELLKEGEEHSIRCFELPIRLETKLTLLRFSLDCEGNTIVTNWLFTCTAALRLS